MCVRESESIHERHAFSRYLKALQRVAFPPTTLAYEGCKSNGSQGTLLKSNIRDATQRYVVRRQRFGDTSGAAQNRCVEFAERT